MGQRILERGDRVDVLFTHLHADHIFGFPFFAPIYAPSHDIVVSLPASNDDDARRFMGRYMNGVNHPMRPREVPARLTFRGLCADQTLERGPFEIQTIRLNHPGGALGYRIDAGGSSIVYISDTAPLARPGEGVAAGARPPSIERRMIELMSGADCVIFDTMFSWDEYLEKMTWGHAYPEYAASLCEAADAGTLYLFHHSPDADDAQLDALAEAWSERRQPGVLLAKEGLEVDLEG